MIGILLISLTIILSGALPWAPYSAVGRMRNHNPWDWLLDIERASEPKELTSPPMAEAEASEPSEAGTSLIDEFAARWPRSEDNKDRLAA